MDYVTCFCGRPLGHLYPAFVAMTVARRNSDRANEPIGDILDALNITKECCRVRIMSGAEFKNYYNTINPIQHAPTIVPTLKK